MFVCRFKIYLLKYLLDVSKYFGEYLLGPSSSQLRRKQQKMDFANCDDTAPPTPALNAQILPIRNGSLVSLIANNSKVNIVVWFNFFVNYF